MLDHVVFARRHAPDWAALSADHRAGRPIDPARYVPPHNVPTFPDNVANLITNWNQQSAVDFFTCRARLRGIAATLLKSIEHAIIISYQNLPSALPSPPYLLFFCDDDDWFAPSLFSDIANLDMAEADVAVFPLVRLEANSLTFLNPQFPPPAVIGQTSRFSSRYQTNNYALSSLACTQANLAAFQDHLEASENAASLGLHDQHFPTIVSATNKSPASASLLIQTLENFEPTITAYLRHLKRLPIPAPLAWLNTPLWDTIRLFETACPRAARHAR